VTLLGTGGTIASRLDYRTGAVIPAFTPGELYGAVPELADICNLTTKKLFGVFSENMAKEQYIALAEAIGRRSRPGPTASSSATAPTPWATPRRSCRSWSRTARCRSSWSARSARATGPRDAALNLIHSVRAAAYGDIAEVMICMFGPTSDRYGLLHRGTRCRKMHSSYRSTFRTIGDIPLAMVSPTTSPTSPTTSAGATGRAVRVDTGLRRPDDDPLLLPRHEARPRRRPRREGLPRHRHRGHRPRPRQQAALPGPQAGRRRPGVHVVMTVQTLWGYAQMYVYDTGRDLMDLGIVPSTTCCPRPRS
jgi:glutamyl-tRNA(Gln) amidotransferase subunit D